MSIEQKIAAFLDRADPKAGASKLEPYTELVRTLRQRRWTYSGIAGALQEEFGVTVSPSTIFAFVRVRAKRKRIVELPTLRCVEHLAVKSPRKQRFNLDA